MLKIDVSAVKNHSEKLSRLINSYEENAMSISREIQNADTIWHDDNTEKFFTNMAKEKAELKEFISSLNNVTDSYKNIIDKIKKIQINIETLYVDQTKKNSIMSTYSVAISNMSNIRNRLNGLSTYFCTSYERNVIRNEAYRIGNIVQNLENSKKRIENLFSKFDALESEINLIFSKINISSLSEIDYSEYL